MTPEQLESRIASWISEADKLSFDARARILRVHAEDGSMTVIQILNRAADSDRLVLEHRLSVTAKQIELAPADSAKEREELVIGEFQRLARLRSALLNCEMRSSAGMLEAVITHVLYHDGSNRHTFMLAVREVERARRMMTGFLTQLASQRQAVQRLLEELSQEQARKAPPR